MECPADSPPVASVPRLSIVVPMLNEAENVASIAREIAASCGALAPFEAIFVNDGSTDATTARIAELRGEYDWLREVRHAIPCGQSAAVLSGVRAARAAVICTIDGDGQNPPAEIPRLVAPFFDGGCCRLGLVAGQRIERRDTASKRFASRFANGLRAWLLDDLTRDTGCGLKAFPRAVFLSLPYFDHLHRFLPALVRREGYEIRLVDVSHRPRAAGRSKYTNFGRAFVGIVDLAGVWWLLHRRTPVEIVHEDP